MEGSALRDRDFLSAEIEEADFLHVRMLSQGMSHKDEGVGDQEHGD